jgi:hypothetical protein
MQAAAGWMSCKKDVQRFSHKSPRTSSAYLEKEKRGETSKPMRRQVVVATLRFKDEDCRQGRRQRAERVLESRPSPDERGQERTGQSGWLPWRPVRGECL